MRNMDGELAKINPWEKNIDMIADEIFKNNENENGKENGKRKPCIILPEDIRDGIMEKCDTNDTNKKIKYNQIPEPFAGHPEAPIYLLNLNPGTDTYEGIRDLGELEHIRERLNTHILWNLVLYSDGARHRSLSNLNYKLEEFKEYPFYPLDPHYKYLPPFVWWYGKLKYIINEVKKDKALGNNDLMKSIEIISRSIFNIDIFPYHSRGFPDCANRELFPSQKFGIYLVKKAIEDKKIIIIMQGARLWTKRVEGLEDYSNAFTFKIVKKKGPRNPVISEGKLTSIKEGKNLSERDDRDIFKEIIKEIKKRANNNI